MRLVLLAVVVACVSSAACTTTDTRLATGIEKPAAGVRVLVVNPDVHLSILTAAGQLEPRDDWTKAAEVNLAAAIAKSLEGKTHTFVPYDPSEAMGGRGGQILRLNEAVGAQIAASEYGAQKLPTKKGSFDWTLGAGATEIARQTNADYALFVVLRGSHASGGRVATMVGLTLLGVAVPLGSQQAQASLVNLRTGQVLWFNVLIAAPGDAREVRGADATVKALLKDLPL